MLGFIPFFAERTAERLLSTEYKFILLILRLHDDSVLAYDSRENRHLFDALVAAEDRRFTKHLGVDIRGLLRALYVYLRTRRIEGASTIDQQLVRVTRGRYEVTIGRKLSEMLMAVAIQRHFSKSKILELYVENAYFGWRGQGIVEICHRLGFEVGSLNVSQAALIAALIKLPLPKTPSKSYQHRLDRRIRRIRDTIESKERK